MPLEFVKEADGLFFLAVRSLWATPVAAFCASLATLAARVGATETLWARFVGLLPGALIYVAILQAGPLAATGFITDSHAQGALLVPFVLYAVLFLRLGILLQVLAWRRRPIWSALKSSVHFSRKLTVVLVGVLTVELVVVLAAAPFLLWSEFAAQLVLSAGSAFTWLAGAVVVRELAGTNQAAELEKTR